MLIDNSQQFEQSMRRILSDAAMDVNLVCVADNKAAQQLLAEVMVGYSYARRC